jgi:hypothetical protein
VIPDYMRLRTEQICVASLGQPSRLQCARRSSWARHRLHTSMVVTCGGCRWCGHLSCASPSRDAAYWGGRRRSRPTDVSWPQATRIKTFRRLGLSSPVGPCMVGSGRGATSTLRRSVQICDRRIAAACTRRAVTSLRGSFQPAEPRARGQSPLFCWCCRRDLNPRPTHYECGYRALAH